MSANQTLNIVYIKHCFLIQLKIAQKRQTVFNLSHQVEYELKITEQCAITQKIISVKCKFCDVYGREVKPG